MKKLTNAEIIQLLRTKVSTYKYFYQLKESEYAKRIDWFEAEIKRLLGEDPSAIDGSHYYNQNWNSSLKVPRKKGA